MPTVLNERQSNREKDCDGDAKRTKKVFQSIINEIAVEDLIFYKNTTL